MKEKKQKIIDWILWIAVVGSTVALFLARDRLQQLQNWGYLGVFLLCFASNATVFLPAPSLLVVAGMAQMLSPLPVALIGALGSAGGECIGYLFGRTGQELSGRFAALCEKLAQKIHRLPLLVFVLALLPLPLFDFAGVYAGARKMNPLSFYGCCALGKFIKMLLAAFGATQIFNLMKGGLLP